MKANPDKYHLLINNSKESFQIKIGNETVSNSKYEKLLGVKIDHELNFNEHVSSLCKKASQKLNALSRKKRLWHRCLPVNFAKFLRTSFLQNTSRQLLLIVSNIVINIPEHKGNSTESRLGNGTPRIMD